MKESKTMTDTRVSKLFLATSVITILAMVLPVAAQVTTGQTSSTAKAKKFATAQDAAKSLIDAAEKFDETALAEVLGPDSYDIIHTGEPARDRQVAKEFAIACWSQNSHFSSAEQFPSCLSCYWRGRMAVSGADREDRFRLVV